MNRMASFFASAAAAIRDIFRNRLTHILLGLGVAYWSAAAFIEGKDLIEVLGLVAIGVYSAAAIRWVLPAIRSLREGDSSGVAQLLLGVTFFMASSAVSRIWSQLWRWNDYAGWMVESPWLGFIMLSSICGAAMMITSPGATEQGVPNQNWRALAIAVGLGGVLVGFMIGRGAVEAKSPDPLTFAMADSVRPQCRSDQPVWGNARTRIYHEAGSPYRMTIKPTACFRSVGEARANGYRPATPIDR